jgi:hypothetical protein
MPPKVTGSKRKRSDHDDANGATAAPVDSVATSSRPRATAKRAGSSSTSKKTTTATTSKPKAATTTSKPSGKTKQKASSDLPPTKRARRTAGEVSEDKKRKDHDKQEQKRVKEQEKLDKKKAKDDEKQRKEQEKLDKKKVRDDEKQRKEQEREAKKKVRDEQQASKPPKKLVKSTSTPTAAAATSSLPSSMSLRRVADLVVEDPDEDLWKDWERNFFVGTEWENMSLVTSVVAWNFNHLEEAMMEGGELANLNKPVYFFGITERMYFKQLEDQRLKLGGERDCVCVCVCVDCIW